MRFLVDECLENDFVLVTNNAADFRKLYAQQPLHAGLVILIPNLTADLQKRLFSRAVGKLIEYGEPVNHVLEVDVDGEDVIFELYELPPATTVASAWLRCSVLDHAYR